MKYRKLGRGLEVSAIGVGCMPMIKGGNILYGEDADMDEATGTKMQFAKSAVQHVLKPARVDSKEAAPQEAE